MAAAFVLKVFRPIVGRTLLTTQSLVFESYNIWHVLYRYAFCTALLMRDTPNFCYTTAAFTISPEPWASLCCANSPGNLALYAVSVRRLIALHSGFLQTEPHDSALAFG